MRPMRMRPFEPFVAELTGVVAAGLPVEELVRDVAARLERLLAHEGWLAEGTDVPVAGKPYSQYLLHLAPDASFSVVSFVWPAGSSTPVHDHGCWGVVGVYRGEETETSYRVVAGDRERGRVSLEEGATAVMRPGDVAVVLPPQDVHQVSNRGAVTAVSIHVYGSDIGRQRRHVIDPTTGAVRPFVSGYDRP